MIKIVHVHASRHDVYIGRPSIWGNPFHIDVDGDRDTVISRYASYMDVKLAADPELVEKLLALDGKTVGCYCRPKRCHGDALNSLLEKYKRKT